MWAVISYENDSIICRIRLATTWMNEEWYNDQIRLAKDRNWVTSSNVLFFGLLIYCNHSGQTTTPG
jgi:hypothetical protein